MTRSRLNPMLLRPNDWYGYIQVLGNIALFMGLLWLAFLSNSLWFFPLLIAVIGIAMHRLFFPLHDCLHYSLFQSRSVNNFFGHLLAALLGTAFKPFRDQHIRHHRYFATPEDPGAEDYQVRFASRHELLVFLLAPLVGFSFINRLLSYLRRFWESVDDKPTADKTSSILGGRFLELVIVIFIQGGICALVTGGFQLTELWRYPVFVILPGVTVFLFLNRLRMFLEHVCWTTQSFDDLSVQKPMTRTIYATSLERILLCGGNFNYHHEHHLYPSVPGCHLPELHQKLKLSLDPDQVWQSYWQVLHKIWNNLV